LRSARARRVDLRLVLAVVSLDVDEPLMPVLFSVLPLVMFDPVEPLFVADELPVLPVALLPLLVPGVEPVVLEPLVPLRVLDDEPFMRSLDVLPVADPVDDRVELVPVLPVLLLAPTPGDAPVVPVLEPVLPPAPPCARASPLPHASAAAAAKLRILDVCLMRISCCVVSMDAIRQDAEVSTSMLGNGCAIAAGSCRGVGESLHSWCAGRSRAGPAPESNFPPE
jgi:hypothetical protein